MIHNTLIQSPLNYTGGKYKLLSQLLLQFPCGIDTFVDLFCGGCNVGINVSAQKVIFNDNKNYLYNLYKTFLTYNKNDILLSVHEIIEKYGFSDTSKNGYAYYGADSSKGLGCFNRKPFIQLRSDFNKKPHDKYYYMMLFVLTVFSFNNQIRFNAKGEFTTPVGKRDFNDKMKMKLSAFIDRLQASNYYFDCKDFSYFETNELTHNSLVYCDPPYLITCATYNEQGGWDENHEYSLLKWLDFLNSKNIRFALSNVLVSKGKTNKILMEWARKYHIVKLSFNYSNSNYHQRSKISDTQEVLIINY
ncbi:MAG: DNA adenine methylase [Candidatus Cloacimonetes bacterium]|nr:DNA adenine methylase [Candidatus Cloacimonadota bacterium]